MKLKSLQEFYNNSESKDISLYLNYLEEKKKEIQEGLDDAISLGLDDKVVAGLKEQIRFIEDLELIIKDSYKDLLKSSIDYLSHEELKEVANKLISESGCYEEEKRLSDLLSEKINEKQKQEEQEKELLASRGYQESYYKAQDTDFFFREIKSPKNYIKYLLDSNMNIEELRDLLSNVNDKISNELADMIIKLRKIIKLSKSEEAVNETINSFMTSKVMGKITRLYTDEECQQLFIELQKKLKLNTEFFKGIPKQLQESILEEGFIENGTYDTLRKIYSDYQKNGSIVMPKNSDIQAIEEEITNIREQIDSLKRKISDLESVISNADTLKEYIKNNLIEANEKDLSYNSLKNYLIDYGKIAKPMSEKERLESYRQDIYKIMTDIDNHDLDIIHARNGLRIMNDFGSDTTEEAISPIYTAEQRRLKQYQIIVEAIRCLNDLKNQIDAITNSRNIIKNINGANKQAKSKLLSEYNSKCKEYYEKLEKADLLNVIVCHHYLDKESEMFNRPNCFEAIFNGGNTPLYTVTDSNYDEFRARKTIPNDVSKEDLNNLFSIRYSLATALFTAERTETMDYMLKFSLDDNMLSSIIGIQEEIVDIYKKLYESRKQERLEMVRTSELPLSQEIQHLTEGLNINEGSITENSLEELNQKLIMRIKQIDEENKEEVPEEERTFSDMSLEDIKEYYSLLAGIYKSVLSSDEVKKNIPIKKL